MRVADIIRADKSNIKIGEWSAGKITNGQFPISRSSLHLGRGWEWRIVTFDALETSFRVLIALSEEREYFRAILALDSRPVLRVICHHELHTSHLGWHCHFYNGDIQLVHPGVLRDKETFIRWPGFTNPEKSVKFTVTKDSALTVAAERFRFYGQGTML